MVCDSLRYWAQEMHVDGFRFDLGTILAREPGGFDTHNGFMKSCMQDPVLSKVKLIAEPWDCGPGGYQVGAFPPGWAEWNDKYRDTVRDYWRGEAAAGVIGDAPQSARRTCFRHRGRQPWASVNFVTAHDGYTLHDLVTYNEKHNEANGEENRDGHSHNRSWNHGVEGETEDEGVNGLRERQMKNLLATMLLSQGTPMILAGDERGRTQRGNNNAYCQNNEISWVDWSHEPRVDRLVEFTQQLIELRHRYPILRRVRWLTGNYDEELEVRDVTWIGANGEPIDAAHWADANLRTFGMLLDGRARETGIRRRGEMATLLIVFNSWQDTVMFRLPPAADGGGWILELDTNLPSAPPDGQRFEIGCEYGVTGRSLVMFQFG
jgi:glycogen operon protein